MHWSVKSVIGRNQTWNALLLLLFWISYLVGEFYFGQKYSASRHMTWVQKYTQQHTTGTQRWAIQFNSRATHEHPIPYHRHKVTWQIIQIYVKTRKLINVDLRLVLKFLFIIEKMLLYFYVLPVFEIMWRKFKKWAYFYFDHLY